MPPEDIPEDSRESYPCPHCGGDIIQIDGVWQCNNCDVAPEGED